MWCLSKETHRYSANEKDWKREWPGEVFLRHKRSNSARVGILFSRTFTPRTVEVLDIILRVNALYENVKVVFICVYALVLSTARMNFLNVLSDVVHNCDDYLFLGGDFNCTEDFKVDRNHLEPHPAFSAWLGELPLLGSEDSWRLMS